MLKGSVFRPAHPCVEGWVHTRVERGPPFTPVWGWGLHVCVERGPPCTPVWGESRPARPARPCEEGAAAQAGTEGWAFRICLWLPPSAYESCESLWRQPLRL